MAKAPSAKGLDAAAAQELIELALKSLTNDKVAVKARSAIGAALELARESSLAAGKRTLSITGIEVGFTGELEGEDDESVITVFNTQPVDSGPDERTPIGSKPRRIPIKYGGTGYACWLMWPGPPPIYVCVTW